VSDVQNALISIVVPIYNESENIQRLFAALGEALDDAPGYEHEVIFVDDGSTDGSADVLEKLATLDPRVKIVEFTRNFGKEMATTAGIQASSGAAVIIIDGDLQHPPELIPRFIDEWQKGAEVVVGIRRRVGGVGTLKRVGSRLFYAISRLISRTALERGETDFRLIDRAVAEAFKDFSEQMRMTRSLINWLGFKKARVWFEAPGREYGATKYSFRALFQLALRSFVTNSLLPLRFAGYLGLTITVLFGALGLTVFIEKYLFNDTLHWGVSGSAQLAIIDVFLMGVTLIALGLIALYIENIHVQISGRPLYVVRKKINL
jgi:glycosyltransferase involved in cell wall biosynthesis